MKTNHAARPARRPPLAGRGFMSPARERAEFAKFLANLNARLDEAERQADENLAKLKEMAQKNR